jgi:hypothetical protein
MEFISGIETMKVVARFFGTIAALAVALSRLI